MDRCPGLSYEYGVERSYAQNLRIANNFAFPKTKEEKQKRASKYVQGRIDGRVLYAFIEKINDSTRK